MNKKKFMVSYSLQIGFFKSGIFVQFGICTLKFWERRIGEQQGLF